MMRCACSMPQSEGRWGYPLTNLGQMGDDVVDFFIRLWGHVGNRSDAGATWVMLRMFLAFYMLFATDAGATWDRWETSFRMCSSVRQ
jgi:hypothetical protein